MKLKCILSPTSSCDGEETQAKLFPLTVGKEYEAVVTKHDYGFNYQIIDDLGKKMNFHKINILFRIV